jgi:transcriptional regulator with XRE-family HTH domain
MRVSRRPGRTARDDGPDPIDRHVGKRVRRARLDAGLSQEELGRGVGVSFQAVQKYEQGENRVSASRLFRTAQLVDQPISFFFEGLDRDALVPDVAVFLPEELDLVRHYRRIESKEVRMRLLRLAKRIGSEPLGA